MELSNINLSRVFFAFTAMYHFLFVPLTIGLAMLVTVFEGIGLYTKNEDWYAYARYWGWFFPLFFVCGIVTGYPLRWQIDSHWAYYGELVQQVISMVFDFEGKLFPVLLTLVVLFSVGWRLPRALHFVVSLSLALALVLQSTAILGLNAWMQNPVFTNFDSDTLIVPDLWSLMLNPMLPPKVLHQVISSWTLAGMLVVSLSGYFMIRRRNLNLARNSFKLANYFTLVGLLGTGLAGHWSGSTLVDYQPMKFAAIEALWQTKHADDFVLFAIPNQQERANEFALEVPGLLKIITAESNSTVKGFDDLTQETSNRIKNELTIETRHDTPQPKLEKTGYSGLISKTGTITNHDIEAAALGSIPNVKVVFWSFRVMLAMWLLLLLISSFNLYKDLPALEKNRAWLWVCVLALPAPWIATEAGWLVCEVGRQPWAVTGLLPTISGGSIRDAGYTGLQLLTYAGGYGVLFLLVLKLSFRHMKKGWSGAHSRFI